MPWSTSRADVLAHCGSSGAALGRGARVDAHQALVPDLHPGEDDLDRHLDQRREVGPRCDDVLAGDDEGRTPAMPVLTWFMCRLISLHVSCSLRR